MNESWIFLWTIIGIWFFLWLLPYWRPKFFAPYHPHQTNISRPSPSNKLVSGWWYYYKTSYTPKRLYKIILFIERIFFSKIFNFRTIPFVYERIKIEISCPAHGVLGLFMTPPNPTLRNLMTSLRLCFRCPLPPAHDANNYYPPPMPLIITTSQG